jgi:hypothetical protein
MAAKRRIKQQTVESYTEPKPAPENLQEKQKKILPPKTLTNIKLTEKQKHLVTLVEDSDITVITGPAGCLTKNSKIWIYTMKSKNKNHSIIYEKSTIDT